MNKCILCNKNEIYKGKVCKTCYDKLPKIFDKDKPPIKIYTLYCDEHKIYYLCGSPSTICPDCLIKREENEIIEKEQLKLERIKNPLIKTFNLYCVKHQLDYIAKSSGTTCPSCFKEREEEKKLEKEKQKEWDLNNLPLTFDKYNPPKKPNKLWCEIHKTYYLGGSSRSNCPLCEEERNNIKQENIDLKNNKKDKNEKERIIKEIKLEKNIKWCLANYPSTFDVKRNLKNFHIIKCKNHGYYNGEFYNSICPVCLLEEKLSKEWDLENLPLTFNKNELSIIINKIWCEIHKTYYLGSNSRTNCPLCEDKIIKERKSYKYLQTDFYNEKENKKKYKLYCDNHKIYYFADHNCYGCPLCIEEKLEENNKEEKKLKEWKLDNLPLTFDRNYLPKTIHTLYCDIHKTSYLGGASSSICPFCMVVINLNIKKLKEERDIKIQIERKVVIDKYTLNNIPLDLNKIKELKLKYLNNPGVLFIYGNKLNCTTYYCLTGGQTINLFGHIMMFQRRSNRKINIKNEKDTRWYEIANNYDSFKIIVTHENIINFKEREMLEMNEALENNAIHWKPSATQIHYM